MLKDSRTDKLLIHACDWITEHPPAYPPTSRLWVASTQQKGVAELTALHHHDLHVVVSEVKSVEMMMLIVRLAIMVWTERTQALSQQDVVFMFTFNTRISSCPFFTNPFKHDRTMRG
jgi:P2-related tail formation protein